MSENTQEIAEFKKDYKSVIAETLEFFKEKKSSNDFDEWVSTLGNRMYSEKHVWGSLNDGSGLSSWGGRLHFVQYLASLGMIDITKEKHVVYYKSVSND